MHFVRTYIDRAMEGNSVNDPYYRHLFERNDSFNVYKNEGINLSVGAPGPELLKNCAKMVLEATNHRMAAEEKEGMHYLFQYGATSGLWECREEISKFLSRRYQNCPVKRENLFLTCGATHGLQLLLTIILSPNGVVFVEEVTYMIALEVFKQFPLMKIVTVPMKNHTVDLDALEKLVEEEKNKSYILTGNKIFWGMFYTIPTYHNPTGTVLPEEKCKKLVDIARKHSIAVVCDDVYNLLNYGHEYPKRLFAYDSEDNATYKGGNVISNGSFSKIFAPAMRLGWLEAPQRVVKRLQNSGTLQSGGAPNHYVSGLITSLLELKFIDEHLDLLIKIYSDRLKAMCDALDRYLPRGCSYEKPKGGYFIWIRLPQECDAADFINWGSEKYRVTAIPGYRFSFTGETKNFLRLSLAFYSSETLQDGVQRLCEALDDYMRNHMKRS